LEDTQQAERIFAHLLQHNQASELAEEVRVQLELIHTKSPARTTQSA